MLLEAMAVSTRCNLSCLGVSKLLPMRRRVQALVLDKCRVVAVQKNLIFKSVVTKEFMVLKSNNVRAVSPGAQVVVSAMPETDTEEERPVAKVSAIIGSCIFVGNVKITDIDQAKELFRLHLTSTQDVQAMRSNNQHIIGWHFQDFALYTSPKWIIGSVRQENTF